MEIKHVRNAVPVYPGISEQEEALATLTNNTVLGEYSIYRGVLVFWDRDYDTRVLTFIDNNEMVIPRMLAVSEHKAFLTVLWLNRVPNLPKEVAWVNENYPHEGEVAGDGWQVESHRTSSHIWLPILKAYMLKAM